MRHFERGSVSLAEKLHKNLTSNCMLNTPSTQNFNNFSTENILNKVRADVRRIYFSTSSTCQTMTLEGVGLKIVPRILFLGCNTLERH